MKKFTALFLALISLQAFAAGEISVTTKKAIATGIFKQAIGSVVELKTSDENLSGEAVFLGNVIRPEGTESYRMYLNTKTRKIHYVDSTYFTRKNSNLQTVIDPYQQVGGTCTGYAINGYLNQINYSGFEGTGLLWDDLSTEEGRSQMLADAINEYYLTPSHRYSVSGILNKYGKKYGFKCKMTKTESYEQARKLVLTQLESGLPIIISFNIGREMVKSPFSLEMYKEAGVTLDERLWIPRRVGDRNSGGHTVFAAGSFVVEGKTYLLIVDSDWHEPRVWDMDEYLNHKKTALKEIEFISCK